MLNLLKLIIFIPTILIITFLLFYLYILPVRLMFNNYDENIAYILIFTIFIGGNFSYRLIVLYFLMFQKFYLTINDTFSFWCTILVALYFTVSFLLFTWRGMDLLNNPDYIKNSILSLQIIQTTYFFISSAIILRD